MKISITRLRPLLLASALTTTSAPAQSPCSGLDGAMAPQLEALIETADYITVLPESVPEWYRNFRGLIIEENRVVEHYPLLTSLFFDAGDATLPPRYALLVRPDAIASFVDSTIAGGTLEKYYHLLNIIGLRMRWHPETSIEVVGCNSKEAALGETLELSRRRAEFVRKYLRDIWRIDERRMRVLARDLPEHASDGRSPESLEENRRVEIRSDDWEVMRPISSTEMRRYPQPEELRFRTRTGIARERIASSTIEITRGGEPWHTMALAIDDTLSAPYDWSRNGDRSTFPTDEAPYRARLVVRLVDGTECVSPTIEVPVLIITSERKFVERLVDREIDRFSVLLFQYGVGMGGSLEQRTVRELIAPRVRARSEIRIDGHASGEPSADDLSKARAAWVSEAISRMVPGVRSPAIIVSGVGERYPLYPGNRPEGRCYNRTVQVIITTPTGD